jgi:hypothetical protein
MWLRTGTVEPLLMEVFDIELQINLWKIYGIQGNVRLWPNVNQNLLQKNMVENLNFLTMFR